MTPSELKYLFETQGRHTMFFSRDAMRFFGDTMKNFGVRSHGVYWELYRKKPVSHGRKDSFFFHKETLDRVSALQMAQEDKARNLSEQREEQVVTERS